MRLPRWRSALRTLLVLSCALPAASSSIALARLETPPVAPLVDAALVERIVEIGTQQSRVHEYLRILTRRYGPRLTGSPILEQAEHWAVRVFGELGLEARREQWGEYPVGFWRGPAVGRVILPQERELAFSTPAWSPGTLGPVRGRAVLEPESFEALEALRPKLAGAWLLRPRVERGQRRAREERLSEGGEESAGRARARELALAFEKACEEAGLAGRISPGASDGRIVTSGNHRIDPEKLPSEVRVMLRSDHFDEIAAWLREGREVELEFDIDNRFLPGPVKNHNVVADLVGRERPDEFVIVQAHLDSWDGAEGACDNGTGVSTTLEAARILVAAGVRPRRTIRFVLYSGEEQGLYGSRGYVRDHVEELPRTSVVLNHDEGTNHIEGIHATPAMLADFERVFAPVKALDPERPFRIVEQRGLRAGGSSDHASFVSAGVPGFHWIQSGEGYSRIHHTQHDTFESASWEEQRHSALVVALAAYGFAELETLVDRTKLLAPPPRRLGIRLEETRVASVSADGRAAQAGWQEGDVVLEIDGVAVATREAFGTEIEKGGPRKTFKLRRGEEVLESVVDWSEAEEAAPRPAREE